MIKYFSFMLLTLMLTFTAYAKDNIKSTKETKPIIIDNRTESEYNSGHIEGAKLIPYDVIADKIKEVAPNKDAQIILYCRSGRRSGIAQQTLKSMGYKNVENYGGMQMAKEKLGIK